MDPGLRPAAQEGLPAGAQSKVFSAALLTAREAPAGPGTRPKPGEAAAPRLPPGALESPAPVLPCTPGAASLWSLGLAFKCTDRSSCREGRCCLDLPNPPSSALVSHLSVREDQCWKGLGTTKSSPTTVRETWTGPKPHGLRTLSHPLTLGQALLP